MVKVAGATTNEDITVYASGLAAGDSIKLGVRPEEFHFTDDVRSTDLILEGRVQSADRLGNITYAYIEAEKGSTLTVQTFINRNIKTGSDVTLSVSPERIHVFNSEGMRC